jgi:hypothetical protein
VKNSDRIKQLEEAIRYAITELREWNPDSEAAKELEELL